MPTTQLTVMPAAELQNLLRTALNEIRPIEAKLGEKKTVIRKSGKNPIGIVFFALAGILFLFGGVFSFVTGLPRGWAIVAMLTGPAIFIPLGIAALKKGRAKASAYAQWMDEELVQLFKNATALKTVPVDYYSSLALEYMVSLLDKGRAATWAECADKYEEQAHRWKLETNTAEAARYAENASRAASSAAIWAMVGAWRR